MNLSLSGHHLDITPAIRAYVVNKLERVTRHFDHVIDVNVVLSVDKLRQQVTANLHIRGKEIHAECVEPDMYAAIDALADKLDRQVVKYKEKRNGNRHDPVAAKRTVAATATAPVVRRRKPAAGV
jgi:putative sigma-54 modulation protein